LWAGWRSNRFVQEVVRAPRQRRWSGVRHVRQYSHAGLIALLHRLGLDYRKPDLVSHKLDVAKQKSFIEDYDRLMRGLDPDEAVVFVDAVHPTHQVRAVGCWAPKDEAVAIAPNSGRDRMNIHGAINLETGKTQMIEVLTVDAQSTIMLLMATPETTTLLARGTGELDFNFPDPSEVDIDSPVDGSTPTRDLLYLNNINDKVWSPIYGDDGQQVGEMFSLGTDSQTGEGACFERYFPGWTRAAISDGFAVYDEVYVLDGEISSGSNDVWAKGHYWYRAPETPQPTLQSQSGALVFRCFG